MKPMVRVYTSVDEFIDREMNDTEFAQFQADQAANVAQKAELESKATQRNAILERLGITAEEAKLLLS